MPVSATEIPTQPAGARTRERQRQPQQLRGERRVEAILDAAATLIVQGGAERLTVQALADRARTSKGSLYHFFPDLGSVLCALADRHTAALTALSASLVSDTSINWAHLSAAEAIEQFLTPLAYLEAHPDLLALARTPTVIDHTTRRLTPFRDLAAHILGVRYPHQTAAERLARASAMVAVADGIVGYGLRSDDVDSGHMLAELHRVLGAYLGALDTE